VRLSYSGEMTAERNHYQVLGVAPTALHEEIRKAHRGLVRALHPDRQPSATAAERSLSERRMREINQAWNVLSDPSRRYAYDRSRGPNESTAGGEPPPPRSAYQGAPRAPRNPENAPGARRAQPAEYEQYMEDDPDDMDVHPGAAVLLSRGPVIAMLIVATLIFVVTAYATSNGGDREVSNESCILLVEGSAGALVDCSLPNDGEVVKEVQAPLDCDEGTRYARVGSDFYCIPLE